MLLYALKGHVIAYPSNMGDLSIIGGEENEA